VSSILEDDAVSEVYNGESERLVILEDGVSRRVCNSGSERLVMSIPNTLCIKGCDAAFFFTMPHSKF